MNILKIIGLVILFWSPKISSAQDAPLPFSAHNKHEKNGFCIGFSDENKQAAWVQYLLTKQDVYFSQERTNDFRKDPDISNCSSLSDFRGSGYDRGHLCPAADRKRGEALMSETFYLSNMSPQTASFNRGVWKKLESLIRDFAIKEDSIIVITGPVFKENKSPIGNGVTVPGFYYKIVLDITGQRKGVAFLLPHKGSKNDLWEFATNIDNIERITNIDFFPGVQGEEYIESNISPDLWK